MLRLWDVTTGAAKRTLNGHTGAVESIAFSPDGSTLASGSYDGTFRLWDLASWTAKQVVHCEDPVRTVAFMPVGHLLVTSDGALHFWTPEGAPLLDLVALRHHDAGYAIGRVGEPQLELLGPDLEAARAALGCRAGVWIYPFELCRERFEQKTVLARTLAGDSSVVDP
jgi:hypothetical protein